MQGRLESEMKIESTIQNKLRNAPDYVRTWVNWLNASGTTASSRLDYLNKVVKFLEWVDDDITNIQADKFSQDLLIQYFIDIKTTRGKYGNSAPRTTSDSYRQGVYYALNNFFGFLTERNLIPTNYMTGIKKQKTQARVNMRKDYLTARDFRLILHSAHMVMDKTVSRRDIAILTLFMTTGMRRTALASINIGDIDLQNGILVVVDKEEAIQTYRLDKDAIEAIQNWLEVRYRYTRKNHYTDALFITYQGNRMTGNTLFDIVTKYTQKALGRSLSPHKLRAGYCSILYDRTGDIEFVRRAVGHSQVSTTQTYIRTGNTERDEAASIMSDVLNGR